VAREDIRGENAGMPTFPAARTVVGCMSGTSADGIDAAAVRILGRGLDAVHETVAFASAPYGRLAEPVRALQRGAAMTAAAIASLSRDLALLHAELIRSMLEQAGQPDLVVMHGQTIHHAPPLSWQLASPAVLAAALDCDVIADLRAADLAEGGEGAPITPLADWLLMRDRGEAPRARAIINLGGFCNATILPAGAPPELTEGFDVCLCNQLLDHASASRTGQPFDAGGACALRGRADGAIAAQIARLLTSQHGPGRSLGSAHECIGLADLTAALAAEDALATLADAVATTIAQVVGAHGACAWFAAGGGTRNAALMRALARHAASRGATLDVTDAIGIATQAREALAMAALGAAADDGVCITLARVTGRQTRRLIDGSLARSHRIFTLRAPSGPVDCG
jgi:anhydro-N-acetylmuramic acid kinase